MTDTHDKLQNVRWSLDELYPALDSPELEKDLDSLLTSANAFQSNRAELTESISAEKFHAVIQQLEAIYRIAHRLGSYAGLSSAADTQNQKALSLVARTEHAFAQVGNQTLFFSLWWKDVSQETANRLLETSGDYRYWLEMIRLFKPHTLTEPEEKIANIKQTTGASALDMLYDTITNRFTFDLTVDGETKSLSRSQLMVYVHHQDPAIRQAAYQELYRVYGDQGPVLGLIYQTLVRDWHNDKIDLRGYNKPISARNLNNDIPDDVVDTLLEVCQRNAGIFQRYFMLKARLLGIDQLRRYDLYAPVVHSDRSFDYPQAVKLVLDAYQNFSPELHDLAQRVISQEHVDSELRHGKRGGAFCATVLPELSPWVLLNFTGNARDIATLAHELGHAVHAMLADEHTLFTQHACLPLAETASTFGEMLLVDHLLAELDDPQLRKDLLFRQVDDAYATIGRQAFFALFEVEAHDMIQKNATVDELADAYLANLKLQFGDAMSIGEEFKWEWVSIPHIYGMPFYVYAYAFGQLLVFALYQRYKEEGEAFKAGYRKILAAGGSLPPAQILREAGVDITSASFWQGGFDVISRMIDQLEQL